MEEIQTKHYIHYPNILARNDTDYLRYKTVLKRAAVASFTR